LNHFFVFIFFIELKTTFTRNYSRKTRRCQKIQSWKWKLCFRTSYYWYGLWRNERYQIFDLWIFSFRFSRSNNIFFFYFLLFFVFFIFFLKKNNLKFWIQFFFQILISNYYFRVLDSVDILSQNVKNSSQKLMEVKNPSQKVFSGF